MGLTLTEKILKNHNAETIDQDYDYWLYQHEKTDFESNFYTENLDAIRDGVNAAGHEIFPEDSEYGLGDKGYLTEKMPYHVRHILRKVSAANGELAQGKITESEAKNLALTIKELAGDGLAQGQQRMTFGEVAKHLSEDTSNTLFGDLGKMDLDEGYVNEFKLGLYAYDALYNQINNNDASDYRKNNVDRITPPTVNISYSGEHGDIETVKQYFEYGEQYDDGNHGIGQIPYGAAVALLDSAEIDKDSLPGYSVNNGNESFYPRNVLFNKYFNKHNICVITPNCIYSNESEWGEEAAELIPDAELRDGKYSETYGALPGFQIDTKNILPYCEHNVLTDDSGHIILAVRAGSSGSYEGIHFIVVERSPLNKWGEELNNNQVVEMKQAPTDYDQREVSNLSDYWTMKDPTQSDFPSYDTTNSGSALKHTYVNFFNQTTNEYKDRAQKVVTAVKGYNSSIQTYIFQSLIKGYGSESGAISFADNEFAKSIEATIKSHINNKRAKALDDATTKYEEAWRTYAEFLINQEKVRDDNVDTGTGYLISETCAIGYLSGAAKDQTGLWAKGGACYAE